MCVLIFLSSIDSTTIKSWKTYVRAINFIFKAVSRIVRHFGKFKHAYLYTRWMITQLVDKKARRRKQAWMRGYGRLRRTQKVQSRGGGGDIDGRLI